MIIVIVLAVLGWACAIVACTVAVRYGLLILTIEDRIEKSLDELDSQYKRLGTILALPLSGDDPHARAIVAAIRKAHDSVLAVANVLAGERPALGLKGLGDDGE